MEAELMFGLGSSIVPLLAADEGIVAFERAVETSWPTDLINQALAWCYNYSQDIPQIYPVRLGVRIVGYVVMPRNDHANSDALHGMFWDKLVTSGRARMTLDGYEIYSPPAYLEEVDPGQPVAVIGYPIPFGTKLPVELINRGIWRLMSQPAWPSDGLAIFLAEVRKGSSSLTSGLILSSNLQGLMDDGNPYLDDSLFASIRDCNTPELIALYPDFAPERF